MCKTHMAEYQRQRAYKLRLALRKYKLKHRCKDCGWNEHHAGLEFDHRPRTTKYSTVAKLALQGNVQATWKEVAKCDVVCGTCHNIRTFKRRQRNRWRDGREARQTVANR